MVSYNLQNKRVGVLFNSHGLWLVLAWPGLSPKTFSVPVMVSFIDNKREAVANEGHRVDPGDQNGGGARIVLPELPSLPRTVPALRPPELPLGRYRQLRSGTQIGDSRSRRIGLTGWRDFSQTPRIRKHPFHKF